MRRPLARLVAAAITVASTGVRPARAEGLAARIEPGYLSSTTRAEADGTTTETESSIVTQKYGLTLDRSLWPLLRLSAGGLLDWSLGSTSTPERTSDVDTKRWNGYARLDAGGPLLRGGGGYDRREDWSLVETSAGTDTSRLIRELISAYALLKPAALPEIDLRLSRSHNHDADRAIADQYLDELALAMRYEPTAPLELRYSLRVANPRDELRGTDTLSTSHFGRVTLQGSQLEGRLAMFASYELSRSESTTRVTGVGGTVSTQQFPVRGLSALEIFPAVPERITLGQNPALVDGNVTATAGLDIGYGVNPAGNAPAREMGVQFADSITPVSEIHVWVDRRLPQDVAGAYAWSAWQSDDNQEWQRIDPVGAVRFDLFESRFEIPIPATRARYLKVVVAPLSPGTTTDPQLASVLVTEVQTFLVEPAESKRGTTTSTRGAFNGSARYLFRRVRGLSYDLSSFVRHGDELDQIVWSVTNGLAYTRRLGRSTTLNARLDRTDFDETRGHESSSGYAVGLAVAPLPTLSASVAVNGALQETTEGTDWRNAVVASATAELYRGVAVNGNGSFSYGRSAGGRTLRSADGRASVSLVPHRAFSLSGTLAATETRTSGAGLPPLTDSLGRLEGSASFTPVPAVLLTGSHTRYLWGRLAPESVSSFGASLSPFSGGALLLRFTFQETIDTAQELRTRGFGPALRWNIRPRWFFDARYTRTDTHTPALDTQSDVFFANLLGVIG